MGMDRKSGRAVTSQMDIRALISPVRALAGRKITDIRGARRVDRLLGKLLNLVDERNLLVHGYWSYESKTETATVHQFRGHSDAGTPEIYGVKKLLALAQSLKADRLLLQRLADQV